MADLWAVLIVLLATGAGLTAWRGARLEARARAEHPPEGRLISVGGHRVHAVQMGRGRDVVLIHGASGNTRDYTFRLAPELAKRYRVTVFDRPGMGYSARIGQGGASIAEQADHLAEAARLLGLHRPVIVGHSYGGAVAMAWALRQAGDASAIVSVAGATHPWRGRLDAFHARLSMPLLGPALAHLIRAWVPESYVRAQMEGVFAPQEAPDGYGDHIGLGLILRPRAFVENARQRTRLRAELAAQSPLYPQITLPVEVVHGTADTTVGLSIHSARLAAEIPGTTLTPLPGIGHMPHHAARARVIAAIDRAALRAPL
ncbi:alpha/beta hydrolase [Pseudooceanicola sp. CBS1P-1]|uniref:Alpha/beta fold hydrolase n=1 Tax=Pseudooceanicola albus TaxID=2692189 RepID=A0A6L7G1L3_9RHOB|nr:MULTISPECIES: alpha/beta hydrolase [Pseudooceanicola]MBT9383204.1 alpha/beta hydrolase [Pseudooceanicola endophyticus]MXN16473.1 alpha/beta fold hydrolase [Pseudooceanicola albus]